MKVTDGVSYWTNFLKEIKWVYWWCFVWIIWTVFLRNWMDLLMVFRIELIFKFLCCWIKILMVFRIEHKHFSLRKLCYICSFKVSLNLKLLLALDKLEESKQVNCLCSIQWKCPSCSLTFCTRNLKQRWDEGTISCSTCSLRHLFIAMNSFMKKEKERVSLVLRLVLIPSCARFLRRMNGGGGGVKFWCFYCFCVFILIERVCLKNSKSKVKNKM